ncbi:MAG: sulfite exporter TauE/SafE family protein [candidate division Zixibacteria bacterium]|nr:sulfite exporter TauE/SafE family protein [candidate division Zixibacteria bacterium]
MDDAFFLYMIIGFGAQMIDGALGMAYGLSASSFLLAAGLPPATVSATVHLAETVTTGTSAAAHHRFGNIDRALFRRLVIPGVIGAGVGAYTLAILPGETIKPYIAVYLLVMGLIVVFRAVRPVLRVSTVSRIGPLGFFGALIDALGGGGWGAVVASTLLARGNRARTTVGTVNAVEFFVTLTSSFVFLLTIGLTHWSVALPLALGGFVASPFAAWACSRMPQRAMLAVVGTVIIFLSCRTLVNTIL